MAFPYDKTAAGNDENGNDINVVATYMRKKHKDHFMIWNISEESYDYGKFDNQVLEYKFPGHPAPPLGLLFKICTSVESWLDADERNVAVIHCLTGKGRTAALIACIMAWIGEFLSPVEALQYISDRRGISVDNLTIPSQRRYVQYFSNMLDGVRPRSEPLLLRRVIINSIPVFGTNGSGADGSANQGCCPYLQLFKNGKLIATATPQAETCEGGAGGGTSGTGKMQLRWINASEGSASFSMDCAIQGDILLRCRHAAASGVRVSMFRAGFHTGYVPSGVLRLTKAQLDGSSADPRYPEDFFIDLIFAPIVKASAPANAHESTAHTSGTAPLTAMLSNGEGTVVHATVSSSSSANASGAACAVTDSGLTIDATSTDKYELGLHKDARFWETVATRKMRGRRRRSRKFVSAQHDQFSIGDDGKQSSSSSASAGGCEEDVEISFAPPPAPLATSGSSGMSGLSDAELIMQLSQLESGAGGDAGSTANSDIAASSSGASVFEQGGDSDDSFTLVGHRAKRSPASSSAAANAELLALEELERELGLGDMQLFAKPTPTTSATATAASAAAAPLDSITGTPVAGSRPTPQQQTPTRSVAGGNAEGAGGGDGDEGNDLDELEKYLHSLSSTPSGAH